MGTKEGKMNLHEILQDLYYGGCADQEFAKPERIDQAEKAIREAILRELPEEKKKYYGIDIKTYETGWNDALAEIKKRLGVL